MPPATANTAVAMPSAVATRSASPLRPSVPALAIRTSAARPTAAPTPLAVDVMPEATPCSRSVDAGAGGDERRGEHDAVGDADQDQARDQRGVGAVR